MNEIIKKTCDITIENYNKVKEELRFDGDYINHYAALIYGGAEKYVPCSKVKKVRSEIKEKTSRMSCFRGDILYIVSLLIALEDKEDIFIDKILKVYDELMEVGFKESQHLVLAAYTIAKHCEASDTFSRIIYMKEIYNSIKDKYKNVTSTDDYMQSALLAINNVEKSRIMEYMDKAFKIYSELEGLSNNSIQGLIMALLLNPKLEAASKVEEMLIEIEKEDIKISRQFLPLLGVIAGQESTKYYIDRINNIIEYLCSKEGEYEYYMDRGFRFFIGLFILEICNKKNKENYLNELLALSIYSFIVSKNNSLFTEVLA